MNYSLWIFQGFSLFSYQCSFASPLFDSDLIILSDTQLFVNNFFHFFRYFVSKLSSEQLVYYHIVSCLSTTFLLLFVQKHSSLLGNFYSISNSFINVKRFRTNLRFNLIENLQLNAFSNQLRYNIMLHRQSQPLFAFILLCFWAK